MASLRVLTATLALLLVGAAWPSPAAAYAVICKHGKYDIDGRSDEQLRIAFGSSACVLRRFSYRTDAENFARNNNMRPGGNCSCR
ncbi:hypothetical protein KTR66_03325 [Roseococcus sp. SDR]|uniref:hypothetical protein n=1 Tax=Roseococcus sp. SDR TaxID=2835532 RepID=UPI001BCF935B|nr:hypothetical protein [Roseococcus sp. SDR]MBS7789009.1 hypothetical protein [Roseococcus sp. SDR]MBV1844323.1 hypothetical protein [Roseococcus sp. SDR]